MDELNRVSIGGFKGVEEIDLNTSKINIITGRNNTGKTSLLEAIHVLFNREFLDNFDYNVGKLINIDFEETSIKATTGNNEFEVTLKHPGEEEALDYFLEATALQIHNNIGRFISADQEEIDFDSIRQALNNIVQNPDIGEVTNDIVILVNEEGEEFPYVYVGRFNATFLDDTEVLLDELKSEVSEDLEIDERRRVRHSLIHPFGFFLDRPGDMGGSTFIKQPMMEDLHRIPKEKQDSVQIDNLEDELKRRELLKDFKSIQAPNLVFEPEEGEKYSIPYEFMGDGFKAIFGMLYKLSSGDKNNILLVEEPETHMHPGFIKELVDFLVSVSMDEDIQFFITTHNQDFLRYFVDSNLYNEDQLEYLKEEFKVINMRADGLVESWDYERADTDINELFKDLRGK